LRENHEQRQCGVNIIGFDINRHRSDTFQPRLIPTFYPWDGIKRKVFVMTQKAQHSYQDEYQMNAVGSSNQSGWIWAGLAAVAVLGLIVWFMAGVGPTSTSTVNSAPPPVEQVAPPPVEAPAPTPAPAPVQQ
jgi:hypothetical protein